MKLLFFDSTIKAPPYGNFGDELNNRLWPKLFAEFIGEAEYNWANLVGIGTILSEKTFEHSGTFFILGSGTGYGSNQNLDQSKWRVYAVRGPQTAARLGLQADAAITDSALLIKDFVAPQTHVRDQRPVAFMPHWSSDIDVWKGIANRAGLYFIDPTGATEQVLSEIQQSDLVITEAMHGAIVADASRIPWVPAFTHQAILRYKWDDWAQSMDLKLDPKMLYWKRFTLLWARNIFLHELIKYISVRRLKTLARKETGQLSDLKLHEYRHAQLMKQVEQIKSDIKQGRKGRDLKAFQAP